MIAAMKWRKLITALLLGLVLMFPAKARAADDEDVKNDARTEGYQAKVQVEKSSVALMWLLFIFLAIVSLAVLFKDARRSHLD